MPPQEPYPLTNAICKADRAKFHLDALTEAVAAFCADSHTMIVNEELEKDQVRYRVHLKQPHVYVYLICGDFLQCLRTALDQAVWSLINFRTGTDSESSEFPVFAEAMNAHVRKSFDRKTNGLSDPAISYIESIQPYNRPAGDPLNIHPLWCLHELNRIDKHRRINVRAQVAIAGRHHFGVMPAGADFALMDQEKTDYGYDIVCGGSYKHLKPKISSWVVFGEVEAGILLTIDEMAQLYNFVRNEVLVSLAGFTK